MSQRLAQVFADLAKDLVHEDGPRISTMRNYRFCIVVHPPDEEFEVRGHVRKLAGTLGDGGWVVRTLSLQTLLLQRLRRLGEGFVERLVEREKSVGARSSERALGFITQKLTAEVEGPDGIAADVAREIRTYVEANPDKAERTVFIIGRAGSLYPFFRSSALLKHLDGRTGHVPVVLLYPGERRGETGLSFMGRASADTDYRPRIYG
jgi:hypothetical protein